jgi:hypothetical protein
MAYSLYIVFGFLLSHYSHIYVYKIRGGKTLMTWYRQLNLTKFEPTIKVVYVFLLIFMLIQFTLLFITIQNVPRSDPFSIFKVGIIYTVIFLLLSQLISSSVMRFAYETLICFIVLAGILLVKVFISKDIISTARYKELWDLLKFVAPFTIGIPILIGSVGFISSFYQPEQNVIRLQLYRHLAMTIYFILGTFCFILYPIIAKILILRENLFK